jgi:hypothetical protein
MTSAEGVVVRLRVSPGASNVQVDMRSSVHPIHTSAGGLTGTIEGKLGPDGMPDLNAPHSAHLELPVAVLKSGNRLEDLEMQRRIDASHYPTIGITLERAEMVDENGQCRGHFEVRVRDRSHKFEENFRLSLEGDTVVAQGRHQFDMRDLGVNPPRIFTIKVFPEVIVEARVVAKVEPSPG